MHGDMSEEYYYPVTRVRVLEKSFVGKQTLLAMLEQKTVADAVSLLTEAGFGGKQDDGSSRYESLLSSVYDQAFRTIYELAPDQDLFEAFLLKNDYHNIKVLIKSELLGQDHPELLLDSGSLPVEVIKTAVRERKFSGLTKYMEQAVLESLDTFSKTRDPQDVDMICDRMEYEEIAEKTAGADCRFLQDYFSMRADFSNFKSFLRARKAEKDASFLNRMLVDGGRIRKDLFLKNLTAPFEAFLADLSTGPHGDVLKDASELYLETGRFGPVEKRLDDAEISMIQDAKRISFGPEILIAYLVAKENEIKNIRIILGGIAGKANPANLAERIRESYV